MRLCRQLPIATVYDLITDVSDAIDQANDSIQQGDGQRLHLVLLASPSLARSPFYGPASLAVLTLLAGQPNEALQLIETAAGQGSQTQRRAMAGRLNRLAAAHPEHTATVAGMVAALRT